MIPGMTGPMAALGSGQFSAVEIGTFSTTVSANPTFSSIDFGSASSTRRMFVGVTWFGTSATKGVLVGATIGGVAATIHDQRGDEENNSPFAYYGGAIISAIVPTGSSGDISFNFTINNLTNTRIYVVRTDRLSAAATDVKSNLVFSNTAGSIATASNTINLPASGFLFAVAAGRTSQGGTGTTTMLSPTPVNSAPSTSTNFTFLANQASNPAKTISAQRTSAGGGAPNVSILAVSWAP